MITCDSHVFTCVITYFPMCHTWLHVLFMCYFRKGGDANVSHRIHTYLMNRSGRGRGAFVPPWLRHCTMVQLIDKTWLKLVTRPKTFRSHGCTLVQAVAMVTTVLIGNIHFGQPVIKKTHEPIVTKCRTGDYACVVKINVPNLVAIDYRGTSWHTRA